MEHAATLIQLDPITVIPYRPGNKLLPPYQARNGSVHVNHQRLPDGIGRQNATLTNAIYLYPTLSWHSRTTFKFSNILGSWWLNACVEFSMSTCEPHLHDQWLWLESRPPLPLRTFWLFSRVLTFFERIIYGCEMPRILEFLRTSKLDMMIYRHLNSSGVWKITCHSLQNT